MIKLIIFKITFLAVLLFSAFHSPSIRILDNPIVWDSLRKQLSLEYLEQRHGIKKNSPYIQPKMIVLHWTAIPTLEQSFKAMNPTLLPGSRKGLASASSLNVSSQFLIDRDGTIYRQLPDTAFARHVIGLNYCAIGIENVGGGEKYPLTKDQLKANEKLIRYLKDRYDIEYLIGHSEYRKFEGHPLWKEADTGYRTTKTDPGKDFMTKIRKRTKNLGLKGAPEFN
ncbi:MAG TPA: peptidoglycan recognition family protein [Sphingobacteriaceae bacterium]|nr:peptidoglycan recognition family protein [Sphingobacteriaceae bacterium]